MDIYVTPTSRGSEMDASSSCSTPLLIEQQNDEKFEDIVCSPSLIQYQYINHKNKKASSRLVVTSVDKIEHLDDVDNDETRTFDDDDSEDLFIEEANVCSNDTLYKMITQKFENCEAFTQGDENDSELKRKLLISSVDSLNHQYQGIGSANIDKPGVHVSNSDMKMAIGGLYLRNPRGWIYIKMP